MHHCPSNCHTHTIQTWDGVAGGPFGAPDHEYPSYLELLLTATDGGQSATAVRLNPSTAGEDGAVHGHSDQGSRGVGQRAGSGVAVRPALPLPPVVRRWRGESHRDAQRVDYALGR